MECRLEPEPDIKDCSGILGRLAGPETESQHGVEDESGPREVRRRRNLRVRGCS